MGDVSQLTGGVMTFSLRRLAAELGIDRDVIKDRITAYGVKPAGSRSGYPTYRIKDVLPALFPPNGPGGDPDEGPANLDPNKMGPTDRKAHYQAENERLKFLTECGQLVLATEVHGQLAHVAKVVTRELATLPDVFERDMRGPPEYTEHLEKLVRSIRANIAAALSQDEDDEDGEDVRGSA
jgi:hypothetical protein